MKRKYIFITLILLIMLAGFSLQIAAQTTLTVWGWRTDDIEIWDRVDEEFPDINIEYQKFKAEEYDSILMTSMQSDEGPDIITSRAGSEIVKYAKNDNFLSLEDLDFSLFPEGVLEQASYNDKVYGVPFATQTYMIYYNKEIYDEYGLKEPKTWDELIQNCEILSENGITPFYLQGGASWSLALVHGTIGSSLLGDEWITGLINGENRFTDSEFIETNRKILELKKYFQDDFMAAKYSDMNTAFPLERSAMVFAGLWDLGPFRELAPNAEYGVFLAPPEKESEKPYAYVYVDGTYAINSDSENKEKALEVLKFTTTKDFGEIFVNIAGEISPISGLEVPESADILKETLNFVENHSTEEVYAVRSKMTYGTPDSYTLLSSNMESLLMGDKTPEEFAEDMDEKISTWYEPFQN